MPELSSATPEQKQEINNTWTVLQQAKDAAAMNVALSNVYKAVGDFANAVDASANQQAQDASADQLQNSSTNQTKSQDTSAAQPQVQAQQQEALSFSSILNNKLFDAVMSEGLQNKWI